MNIVNIQSRRPIKKLPESTIRLIAAGEVVTRPVNVLKELLENSLDAGATNIRVNIEQGGMKIMEITDNGGGIALADSELLCQRFATSKLNHATDLENIKTFGFRGEALASITEVADLEVRTFSPAFDNTGWTASYKSGRLVDPPTSKFTQKGTCLIVKNLFHNLSRRKEVMKATFAEEKKAIIDLMTRYAIHHRDRVTFTLSDGKPPDLVCSLAPVSLGPVIGQFYGLEFETNMIDISIENQNGYEAHVRVVFSYKHFSGTNQSSTFILFVNNRLVECDSMKKELDGLIGQYINTRQNTTLVYIDLKVPTNDVDVNIHPAKATVTLVNQSEINALIVSHLREIFALEHCGKSMTKSGGPIPMGKKVFPSTSTSLKLGQEKIKVPQEPSQSMSNINRPYELIHNDSTQLSLDQISWAENQPKRPASPVIIPPARERREIKLLSLMLLRERIVNDQANELAKMIKHSVFIGTFDHKHALIQYDTGLFAINLKEYLADLHYQFYIYDFGNFPPIKILPPGNKIRHFIKTTLEDYEKNEPSTFVSLSYKTVDTIMEQLRSHAPMYQDYLNFSFTDEEVLTIPNILPGEIPSLVFMGQFLINLVNKVNYDDECNCIRMMGRVIANFYSEPPTNLRDPKIFINYQKTIEEKLWLAIRNYQFISKRLLKPTNTTKVSDTKLLYKVFERC